MVRVIIGEGGGESDVEGESNILMEGRDCLFEEKWSECGESAGVCWP